MTINNDIQNYYLDGINNTSNNVLEKVATGLAINQASDDASGLAIADQLRVQSGTLSQSIQNVNSGVALTNITTNAIGEQKQLLQNIKDEVLKANNGTLNESDRENIENQIDKYLEQYNNIAQQTNYNGKTPLSVSGDTTQDDLTIGTIDSQIELNSVDTESISSNLQSYLENFTTDANSRNQFLQEMDIGINQLNEYQSDFASATNALESSARTYMDAQTNITKAESQIRDLDYSSIVETFSKADIQAQIGSFVHSQANASTSRIIQLLS